MRRVDLSNKVKETYILNIRDYEQGIVFFLDLKIQVIIGIEVDNEHLAGVREDKDLEVCLNIVVFMVSIVAPCYEDQKNLLTF